MKLIMAMTLVFTLGCTGQSQPIIPDGEKTLTVIAMNDWHGGLYESPDPEQPEMAYGGLPTLKAMVDELRRLHSNVILVDGGDSFQGSWPINSSQGKGSVDALSLLGVDASSVGNHEFDYGPLDAHHHPLRGALHQAAANAPFAWLAANVYERTATGERGPRWSPEGILPWQILVQGGVRVAVIGLSTQETPSTTRSSYVQDLLFTDPVEAVRDLLPEIHSHEPDIIIVTGHLTGSCNPPGYLEEERDCIPNGEIGRLLTELPRGTIDVIVAGHEHTILRQRVGDTFVLESRHKGHALTGVTLKIGPNGFDPDTSTLLPIYANHHKAISPGCFGGQYPTERIPVGTLTLQPDPEAIQLLRDLEREAGSLCDVVGCADAPYTTDRKSESPLGRLVAAAMRASMPEATIAITNSGGLRADLPKGTVLRKHVHDVMPFDNKLMLVEIPGKDLLTLLEIGTSGAHGLIQVSGLDMVLHPENFLSRDLNGDGQQEDWEKSRLCEASIGGAPIKPRKQYTIVTSDFLLTGGDHLGPAFENARVLRDGPTLRETIQRHIKRVVEPLPGTAAQFKCLADPQTSTQRSITTRPCKLR